MSGATPATINVTFDATNEPVGVKSFTLQLSSSAEVVNKPFPVQLEMTVEAAALSMDPFAANFVYFPCSLPITDTQQMVVDIGGTSGLNFDAAIIGVPDASAARR